LIPGSGPCLVMVGMTALRMGQGDPAEDFREFSILLWLEEEMPVIGHEAVGGNPKARTSMRFSQNLFKGPIVGSHVKQRQPPNPPVQDVVGEVAGS